MTESQRLTIRWAEIRLRLNEIAGLEDSAITDEIKFEYETLDAEHKSVDTRLWAAIADEIRPEVDKLVKQLMLGYFGEHIKELLEKDR